MRQSPKPTSHKGHPKDSIHLLQGKPDHPLGVDLSAQPGGSEEQWDCQGLTGATLSPRGGLGPAMLGPLRDRRPRLLQPLRDSLALQAGWAC